MAIYNTLSSTLKTIEPKCPPAKKKMLEDTKKKMEYLFDKLNDRSLPEPVTSKLLTFADGLFSLFSSLDFSQNDDYI